MEGREREKKKKGEREIEQSTSPYILESRAINKNFYSIKSFRDIVSCIFFFTLLTLSPIHLRIIVHASSLQNRKINDYELEKNPSRYYTPNLKIRLRRIVCFRIRVLFFCNTRSSFIIRATIQRRANAFLPTNTLHTL